MESPKDKKYKTSNVIEAYQGRKSNEMTSEEGEEWNKEHTSRKKENWKDWQQKNEKNKENEMLIDKEHIERESWSSWKNKEI